MVSAAIVMKGYPDFLKGRRNDFCGIIMSDRSRQVKKKGHGDEKNYFWSMRRHSSHGALHCLWP